MDSAPSDPSRAEIIDSMHVMSNAANRLVVNAQLRVRDRRDTVVGQEIQACVAALLAEFARLRALLWSLPEVGDAVEHSDSARGSAPFVGGHD